MTTSDLQRPRLPWDAAHPYPFYEARRRTGEVVWDDTAGAWLVLGHHHARRALASEGWTSDPRANPAAANDPFLSSDLLTTNMLFTDGHTHDRLRAALRDVFSRTFISQLTEGIESVCSQVISAIATDAEFDVMGDVASPLPVAVIGAWLGLDPHQCAVLRDQSPAVIRLLSGITGDFNTTADGLAALTTLIAEFLPAAAARRARPRDDLLSHIASASDLTLDEVVTTTILIAVAGHETTTNLLGAALARLLTPTEEGIPPAERIDPTKPAVLTELLRLDAPIQAVARTATATHHLGDSTIEPSDSVLVCIAAANRDPKVYVDPDRLRPGRPGPPPLAFGHGAHYCLGAPLARLETATALRHIMTRRPVLTGPPTWRDTAAIRGPLHLPARFTRPSAHLH
jgi:cytochrome P450